MPPEFRILDGKSYTRDPVSWRSRSRNIAPESLSIQDLGSMVLHPRSWTRSQSCFSKILDPDSRIHDYVLKLIESGGIKTVRLHTLLLFVAAHTHMFTIMHTLQLRHMHKITSMDAPPGFVTLHCDLLRRRHKPDWRRQM